MTPFNWKCSYCGQSTTITEPNYSNEYVAVSTSLSKYGRVVLVHNAISCPNPDCQELTLEIELRDNRNAEQFHSYPGEILHRKWLVLPNSRAKPLPNYIPNPIRKDYDEACLICKDSPKASATLSRRCLQGIVRDYWNLPKNKRGNLASELNFIKDKLDDDTWDAIDTIRSVGNIGAHMEKNVDVIVEVDPDESDLLIELIETLLEDWYIARHKRQQRNAKAKALGDKKLGERRGVRKNIDSKNGGAETI